jgi:hypothetical protein
VPVVGAVLVASIAAAEEATGRPGQTMGRPRGSIPKDQRARKPGVRRPAAGCDTPYAKRDIP